MIDLWDHQKKAVTRARTSPHLALFLEIGTGKTGTMITILREEYVKRTNLVKTLIFSPISVCKQWKNEFPKFSKIPDNRIHVLTGTGPSRTKALYDIMSRGDPAIVITNYEALHIKAFYEALLRWSPDIMVMDESHRLKDPTTARAKKIYPLCYGARRRFIMTGTPILNSEMDLYGQYKAMDPEVFGGNFFHFREKYFRDKNSYMPAHIRFPDWQPKPETLEAFRGIVARTSVQARKEECLDLPDLLKVTIPIQLSERQRKVYNDMEKHFVAELKGTTVAADFAMTKSLRLQQIVAGFITPDSESSATWCDDVPRLDAFRELLETLNKEKVIVWTVFKPTYQKLAEIAEKVGYRVAFLTGEQSVTQKEKSIEEFCKGDIGCLISNPSAGGAGINLVEARYAIYYGKGYSLEHYLQSEGRNYRGGSELHEKITHYHLAAENTIDQTIHEALLSKKNVGDAILNWAREKNNTLDNCKSIELNRDQGVQTYDAN